MALDQFQSDNGDSRTTQVRLLPVQQQLAYEFAERQMYHALFGFLGSQPTIRSYP
jgi:hypothetical protein